MRRFLARLMLRKYARHYNYDTTYLETMLREAPAAFFKFARIMSVAQHREVVPVDAFYAAKLVAVLAEDCGPCTQLVVDMAREAGVAGDQIEAVLADKAIAMTESTVLGHRFARAVIDRSGDDNDCRDAVRAQWGEKGVIDLSLALAIGRLFPMLKAGLGYAMECRRVTIDGKHVQIARQAVKQVTGTAAHHAA